MEKKNMVLFTKDLADGQELYAENASFTKYESLDDLKKAVINNKEDLDDIIDVIPLRESDCWIKTYDLDDYNLERWTEEAGELNVAAPGCHPGGNAYWIYPVADTYGPVYRDEDEDEDE